MKYFFLITFLSSITYSLAAQNYHIDSFVLYSESGYVKEYPILACDCNNTQVLDSINSILKSYFMVDEFEEFDTLEYIGWNIYGYDFEISSNIFYITIDGSYTGAYSTDYVEEFYFDLTSGEEISGSELTFESFLAAEKRDDFLEKYWNTPCANEFSRIECGDMEPYCDCNDFSSSFDSEDLILTLTNDCFPHVAKSCTPVLSIHVPLNEFEIFLSDFGKLMLITHNYSAKSEIEQLKLYEDYKHLLEPFYFIQGSIDDKYAFMMAIRPEGDEITGYYSYNKYKTKIPISGRISNNELMLNEMVDEKITGTSYNFV